MSINSLLTKSYLFIAMFTVILSGCGSSSSSSDELVEAELIVTLNDIPLPNAQITLTPMGEGHTGDSISTGITDDNGRVKLMCGTRTGAVLGTSKITVTDPPVGGDDRGQDGDQMQRAAAEQAKTLKNRPIPRQYHVLVTSDLEIEIKKDQKEYKVNLKR